MAGYTHSLAFAELKSVSEEIDQNLTSHQWLSTLDAFLEASLDPIATSSPDLMDNYFAKVVAVQFDKQYTKFSRTNKEELPTLLFNSITSSGKKKRAFQKDMLLNRGLLFGLLTVFNKSTEQYAKIHSPFTRINRVQRLGLIMRYDSPYLYASIRQSKFWATKAYNFKALIMQKFIRLSLMNAQRTYKELNHHVALDDVVQIYLAYLSKAIDRCDSRQGVLTTFIQTWFYSARTAVKQHLNFLSTSETFESVEGSSDLYVPYEAVQNLAAEAKKKDPYGVVRFGLGIPEFFSSQQKTKLSLFKKD